MRGKSVYLPHFERTCPIALCSCKRESMSTGHLCNQTTPRSAHKSDSKWYHLFNTICMYVSWVSQQAVPYLHSNACHGDVRLGHFQSHRSWPVFLCTSRLPQWLLTALSAFSTQQSSQESKSSALPHISPHPYPICPQICYDIAQTSRWRSLQLH